MISAKTGLILRGKGKFAEEKDFPKIFYLGVSETRLRLSQKFYFCVALLNDLAFYFTLTAVI